MHKLGLICRNSSYSFSKKYFTEKFEKLQIANLYSYENFELENIANFKNILKQNPDLIGLNVTIPYKETILPFLDEVDESVSKIGAVNTIKIHKNGVLKGFNTDYIGFLNAIKPILNSTHKSALILGSGGAAKAVCFAFKQMNIKSIIVSRSKNNEIQYKELTQKIISQNLIIVNTTPLGTFPNIEECVTFPFEFLTPNHVCFDLVYNPEKTKFLQMAEQNGATIKNGFEMLTLQAEAAWQIWKE